jgi:hypothetical protein
MSSRRSVGALVLGLWFAVAVGGAAEALPGPREPLTFRDMGLYGGWNEYWLSDACPFNYFIVQAVVDEQGQLSGHGMGARQSWNQWLQRARAQGKRIIADVEVVGWAKAENRLAFYQAGLDRFLQGVDASLLYAITLGEENIFWEGHLEILRDLYAYAKSKCDVPVYQWYSPYAGAPGFGWPHLPADGWLIDEYAHGGASFERFVRSYAVHQLPVVQIVWGSPLMDCFSWKDRGDPAFDWQLAVCRKYGIPCSFFVWEGHGNVWGWSPEALPPSRAVYDRALEWARRARAMDLAPYEKLWDDGASLLPLPLVCSRDGSVAFTEDFRSGGGQVAAGAAIAGFRDLRWDGGPLELRPRQPGPARAVLLYPLRCELPLRTAQVQVSGRCNERLDGRVEVAVSSDGRAWTPPQTLAGDGTISVDLAGQVPFVGGHEVHVRLVLAGRCDREGDVPVALHELRVTGTFEPPAEKAIRLAAAPGVPLRWEADLAGGALALTADIDNDKELEARPGELGTHGVAGYGNTVTLRQRLLCDTGVDLLTIVSQNYADQPNYGATNALGLSLDGKTVLLQQATSGSAAAADLTLDVKDDARFRNVREFWIHLTMECGCGVKTATTNRITAVRIEGRGTPPAEKTAPAP